MECSVYNLEFRPNSYHMLIGGYSFSRVPDYREQHSALQHLVDSSGWEGRTQIQTGRHARTAIVVGPDANPASSIRWPSRSCTALDDIVLLLKLFTARDVFVHQHTRDRSEPRLIAADPRVFPWGGILICSLPFERGEASDPDGERDTTLEVNLPRIYQRICGEEWLNTYRGGYFLVLLSEAMKQRTLESAFIQCWTIWEHLFAVLNDSWMSDGSLRQLQAQEKICNVLVHFDVRSTLSSSEKKRIKDLVDIRNRLIHFGQFPEKQDVHRHAFMFIRMTEYLGAKALGLCPSNVFNTVEQFEAFLAAAARRHG